MKKKVALITGITGQTGSYLTKLLLSKNYKVFGIRRRTSTFFDTYRLTKTINYEKEFNKNLFLLYGDLTDSSSIDSIISNIMPDEIYNLGAQSHVQVSFELPIYTTTVNSFGVLYILETIKKLNHKKKIKFYQASSSEMFGNADGKKLNESSKFKPASPYASSKLYSYWITKNYREAYNIFATNGILFNHESPLRGEHFVTKKITLGLANIIKKNQKYIELGNLDAVRDWGHAKDYAYYIWKMLQLKKPTDLVLCTEQSYSIRDFINECFRYLNIKIIYKGKGIKEKIYDTNGKLWIKINPKFYRKNEVRELYGDATEIKTKLKWKNKTNLKKIVAEMLDFDLKKLK
jgi:GDPmannose 4,6-dehydratase